MHTIPIAISRAYDITGQGAQPLGNAFIVSVVADYAAYTSTATDCQIRVEMIEGAASSLQDKTDGSMTGHCSFVRPFTSSLHGQPVVDSQCEERTGTGSDDHFLRSGKASRKPHLQFPFLYACWCSKRHST